MALALLVAVGCALLAAVPIAHAQQARMDPFRVSVPVVDQGSRARRAAEREGLAIALVRAAGSETILESEPARRALGVPSSYYGVSGYERRPPEALAEGQEPRPWALVLEFDPAAILRVLEEADADLWSGFRPQVLLWLLREEEDGRRAMLGPESSMAQRLLEAANLRGLPAVVPLADLEDRQRISVRDAWGSFEAPLARASARYAADAVMVVRVFPHPLAGWIVEWNGIVADERIEGALEIASADEAGAMVVHRIVDRLVARFAVPARGDAAGEFWLQVDGVRQIERYADMMRYLEGIAGVSAVHLAQVARSSMLLRLELTIDEQQLLDLLAVDGRLRTARSPEMAGSVRVWRGAWGGE